MGAGGYLNSLLMHCKVPWVPSRPRFVALSLWGVGGRSNATVPFFRTKLPFPHGRFFFFVLAASLLIAAKYSVFFYFVCVGLTMDNFRL